MQDELQNMQTRAQYAESRAAVADSEVQSLRKVSKLWPDTLYAADCIANACVLLRSKVKASIQNGAV